MINNRVGQRGFAIIESKIVEDEIEEIKIDKHGVFCWFHQKYIIEDQIFESKQQLIEQL